MPLPSVQRHGQPGPRQLGALPFVPGFADQLGELPPLALEVVPGQLNARLRRLVRKVDDGEVPARSLPAPGKEVLVSRVVRPARTVEQLPLALAHAGRVDRKSTRLNSSHLGISYAVFC